MNYTLTIISDYTTSGLLVCVLVTLLVKQLVPYQHKTRTSIELVAFMTSILYIIQKAWEYYLPQFFEYDEYIDLVSFAWYGGFAITDFAMVALAIKAIDKYSLSIDKSSVLFLACISGMGLLQIARYLDRYAFSTDLLGFIYSNGIPTLNTIMLLSAILNTFIVSSRVVVIKSLRKG